MPAFASARPLKVKIEVTTNYNGDPTDAWTELQMQYVCAAARRFEAVWSSEEFHKKILGLPRLVVRNKWVLRDVKIDNDALYDALTSEPQMLMRVSVSANKKKGWAISYAEGWTELPAFYLNMPERGGELVAALTNTLSHEYTHYSASAESTDGHVVNDPRYVSYGIGCMTQNMAFPNTLCTYDPSMQSGR